MASKSGQLPSAAAAAAALSADSDDDDEDVVMMEEQGEEDSDAEEAAGGGAASNMDDDDDEEDADDGDNENSDSDDENEEEEDEDMVEQSGAASAGSRGGSDDEDDGEGSDIDADDVDDDDDDEDDGDRKPAAKSLGDDGDSDSDDDDGDDEEEDSSSEEDDDDDDSSDDDDAEPSFVTVTDEFGNERTVSAYEAARIERIRRNKERLASLGLEGSSKDGRRGSTTSGGTLLSAHTAELERKKEERRQKREERKKELAEMREADRRSSSRKRKQVSYTEIKESSVDGRKSDGGGGGNKSTSNREVSKWRTEKPREQRVPLFIYKELRRIESDRKKNLKHAERNSRAADIEYRFAKKNAERVEKAIRRREEMEHHKRQWLERQQEKKELQEFFRSIDDRKQDLVQARSAFDQERFAEMHRRSRNYLDHNRAKFDALSRFPMAVLETERHLDFLLLQRCPNDDRALAGMGASLTPGTGPKRSRKKKKKKKAKVADDALGSPMRGAAAASGSATPSAQVPPAESSTAVGSTPGPATEMAVSTGGVPLTTPVTGMLHPSAAPQVYAVQEKNLQKAMTRLTANSGGAEGQMLPPNASGYPNLTGRAALPPIAEKVNSKKKKSAKGKTSDKQDGDAAGELKDAAKSAPDQAKKIKHGVRKRNVGGPVPPEYAKAIQRSWLDNDDVLMPDSTKQFIPQAGDLVLYYPRGHKEFLATHADRLGNKTKQLLRLPLWERAKKEKARSNKESEEKSGDSKPSEAGGKAVEEARTSPRREKSKRGRFRDASPKKVAAPAPSKMEGDTKKAGSKKKKDGASSSPPWWNEEWLASMESDVGGECPILCRVENTTAEFPYNKGAVDIATNRKTSWSMQIDKKKKEEIRKQLTKKRPMLRLAVMLKPLTPVVPSSSNASKEEPLDPPPPFVAQCFPSKSVSPFVLPFFWTYRQSHSLSFGDKVRVQFDDDIYTGEHEALADDSCSLENAFKRFPEIFEDGGNMPVDQRLERLLAVASAEKNASIPLEETRAVLQFVSHYWHQKQGEDSRSVGDGKVSANNTNAAAAGDLHYSTLVDFICATLPRWDNALIRWDASEGEKEANISGVNPWEPFLQDSSKASTTYPGCRPGDLVYSLGGKLLENLRLSIQRYVDENPDSAALLAQVDTPATPEYVQHVPLPMSIQRILTRLQRQPLKKGASLMSEEVTTNNKLCWYRSATAVVSDLNDITHNFVLYSESSSDIVKVRMAVDNLKHIADNLDSNAQRKRLKKESVGQASGQMMLWQGQMEGPEVKERDPFAAPLRRMWAQEIVQDRSWGETISPRLLGEEVDLVEGGTDGASMVVKDPSSKPSAAAPTKPFDLNSWIPQVGDEILYSRNEHSKFLRGHFASLSEKQRVMPSIIHQMQMQMQWPQGHGTGADSSAQVSNGWLVGVVASIHARFPPPPPADDDAAIATRTFDDLTPILEVGIYFNYPWLAQKLQIIHWRPCQVRGSDPAHKAPRKKKKTKPTYRPIRVKALVKKKDVYPGRQLYFKPQALKKNPRLARALGIKKQAVRINVQVNGKNVGPPTKKSKSLIIDRKMFMQDEELYLALYGDDATKPARITVKVGGKSVSPKPVLLPPSVVDSVDGLSDALVNAGVGQYSSMPIYVKVNDQKVLRKPIMLPPYVIEKVSGLAEAIGSVRREPEAEKSEAEDADDAEATTAKSNPLIGETETGQCTRCSLDSEVSFLRPAWIQPTRYSIITPLPPPSFVSPPGVPSDVSSNILRLLEIMKHRSIEGIPPDSVRPEAFADGVVSGRQRSTSIVSTQAAALSMPEAEREALAKVHYLPPWFTDNGNDEVLEGIRKSDAYLPLPYLCLDLVQRRIKQGYYRSLLGATHDIREAYVATVMYLLKSEGAESLKRMAVLLAHRSRPSLPQTAEASAPGNARKKKKKSGDVPTNTFLFGVRVTLKEASLFKRIEQVRKLYGAALTCFSHTIVVETALGKEREGPSIDKVTVNELVTYYRKMEIRKKICHLLDLINPDPCRLRRSIRGGQPNPSVRIKISLGQGGDSASIYGAGTQEGDETAAAAPTTTGGEVAVSEAEVDDVCQEIESEESEVDLSQPLTFDPEDYISSNDLVRALFGTTGRMEACVRCQKAKRGMFTCRIVRAHSIEDFDLDELLGGRGIDGLIHDLLSRSAAQPASTPSGASESDGNEEIDTAAPNKDVRGEDDAVDVEEQAREETGTAAESAEVTPDDDEATTKDDAADASGQDDAAEAVQGKNAQEHALTETERAAQAATAEEEDKEKRMLELFKKAQLAIQLAKQNLLAANAAMDVQPALSKEFVKNFFPYDHADGHYEICVVCGLGGDILCCETCPNVAHTYCAGLAKVPEGDWYCRECVAIGKGPSPNEAMGDTVDTKSATSAPADADTTKVDAPMEGAVDDAAADAEPDTPKGDDQMQGVEADPDAPNADEQAESNGDDHAESKKAEQDPSDNQEAAVAQPSKASTDGLSIADDSNKKVSFEADSADVGQSNSASKAATSQNYPPGNWPVEEKRYDEEFYGKTETLDNILHELKSLRKKPKPASQCKQAEEEEKKADDEDTDDDGSDSDDDSSIRKSRRRSTKVVKRPRRKRAVLELGTKILKEFEGHGDFEGEIDAVPDSDDEYQEYYRVRYLDGDEEDMSEDEAHACVEYWKKKQAKKEPDDPNVRKRRKPKRFETIQAAAELKGSRKKNRQKGGSSSSGSSSRNPSRGRLSTFKDCAVEGCTKQSQGRANDHMCRRHFSQKQRGEKPTVDSSTPANGNKGTPKKKTSSGRATRKRGREKVEEDEEDEEDEEEVEEVEEQDLAPSPRAKRARRGRRTNFNLDGGPHRRPRGKTPEGKLWDSHHGAWVDE